MRVPSLAIQMLLAAGIAALAFWARPVQAQEFYVGAAYEAASGTLDQSGSSVADTDISALQALAGARFQVGSLGFLGGEFETSIDNSYSDNSSVFTGLDRLRRIRAVAGTKVGSATIFASIGQATYDLNSLPSGDSLDGTSIGIGGEFSLGKNVTIRAEAIHDSVDGGAPDYKLDSTSIRAGAVINF